MILNYYLLFDNGMKKDANNHNHHHIHHNHHPTQTIQIITNNANARVKANASSIAVKNVRSSSLPLKIISNSNRYTTNTNKSSNHVRSWTDFSYLSKQRNNFDCFNFNGLYFNYKYRQISRSERFLDFIEFREQQSAEELNLNNFNSSSSISSSSSSPSTFNSEFSTLNKFSKLNLSNKLDEDDEDDFAANQSSNDSSSSSSNEEEVSSISNSNTTLVSYTSSVKNDTNKIELINQVSQEQQETDCETNKLAQTSEEATVCIENTQQEDKQKEESELQVQIEDIQNRTSEENITLDESSSTKNEINNNTVTEEQLQVEEIKNDVESRDQANNNHNDELNERIIEKDETKAENESIKENNNSCRSENETALSESSLASNLIESTRLDEILDKNLTCDVDTDSEKNINNDTLIAASNDFVENEEELSYKDFIPKKSCLKSRVHLNDMSDSSGSLLTDGTSTNATSSPLVSPSSPSYNSSSSLWSSSTTTTNTSTSSSASSTAAKKRVLFADDAGKELYTVRTMSEPSNCPPKLTSKIVQYFLNREFSNQNAQNGLNRQLSNESMSSYAASTGQFLSFTRSYDYGISGLNYTNVNQVSGSLAVYSLNFQQPAGDYLKFRQRLEQKCISLENVLLNGFQVNGTIKVKNIDFHKKVFIRCTFNNWATFEDYQATYVPCEFYSSASQLSPTLSSSSISASFCGSNHHLNYQPIHKDYDTFRFEFQLPKTVENFTAHPLSDRNATASIQLCICYRAGAGSETREFWDNNDGKNYEILQYVIDLERLRPNQQVSISTAATAASMQLKSKRSSYYKYDNNKSSYASSSLLTTAESGIYY